MFTLPNDNKLNGLSSTQETTQLKLIGKHELKKSLLHSNTIPETPHSDFAHTETNPNNTAHSNLIHLKEHSNIHSNISPKTHHSASIVSNPNDKTLIKKSDKKLGDLSIISFEASQTPIPNGKNNINKTLSISKSYLKIININRNANKIGPDDIKLNTKSDKETNDNKDASIVSNPNDKTLKYNKSENKNSLKINNASLVQNHTDKIKINRNKQIESNVNILDIVSASQLTPISINYGTPKSIKSVYDEVNYLDNPIDNDNNIIRENINN